MNKSTEICGGTFKLVLFHFIYSDRHSWMTKESSDSFLKFLSKFCLLLEDLRLSLLMGAWLLCSADGGLQSSIHLLFGQERVPLGHRTPGVGQHVRPMAQPDTGGAIPDPALANGIVAAQLVVVVDCDENLHFLQRRRRKIANRVGRCRC